MRNLIKPILILCALAYALSGFSQLEMGGWQTFFSYNNVNKIAESTDKIYALSDGNLFSVDKEYESIETYTKLTGLSDDNIVDIVFCEKMNTMIIVYNNCNIDLLKNGRIINVPDLKNAEVSSKKINKVTIRDKYAYLSCGFGITVVDIAKGEITDTYIIGNKGDYLSVDNTVFLHDTIFALTIKDIRFAPLRNKNLADFSQWEVLTNKQLPKELTDIFVQDDKLFVLTKNNILRIDNDTTATAVLTMEAVDKIITSKKVIICRKDTIKAFDEEFNEESSAVGDSMIITAIYSPSTNSYWASDLHADGQCILTQFDKEGNIKNSFIPKGPFSGSVAALHFQNGRLITCSGGPWETPGNNPGILQFYEDGIWSIISGTAIDKAMADSTGGGFVDVMDAAIDPADKNHVFAATWHGVFEFQNNVLVHHHWKENPYFRQGSTVNLMTDCTTFDKDGNLWILHMKNGYPVTVMTPQKEWYGLTYSEIEKKETLKELFVDSKGYLWVILPREDRGVFCAYLNKTPFNSNDDSHIIRSSFNDKDGHSITPNAIRCITEDKDGVIWIGTSNGPMLIPDASKYFNSDFVIDRIKITREDNSNYADYLLENEQVNAIVVDGSNRKWIGTYQSGLYLLSPNGTETIHHFTTENSPLSSNTIIDLAINDETGELFIATANGLLLYKSDATKSMKSYKDVFAYPNPVRENFDGPITISGLMESSLVRISDTEGRIIHQGRSNGGTYVWDGNDLNGRRVDTGVYFIYAALDDGTYSMVTKIAFIK